MKRFLSLFLVSILILALLPVSSFALNTKQPISFKHKTNYICPGKTLQLQISTSIKEKITYEYASSDEAVATVSAKGVVKGLTKGEATITCSAVTASGKKYSFKTNVIVVEPIKKIKVAEKDFNLAIGIEWPLTPVITPENATMQEIEWSSSNEKVATISDDGIITTLSKGRTTITAKAKDGSNIKGQININVKEYDLIITTKKGEDIEYVTGSGMFGIGYSSKNDLVYLGDGGGIGFNAVHVTPVAPGEDVVTISISDYWTRRTRRIVTTVFIAPSAFDEGKKDSTDK